MYVLDTNTLIYFFKGMGNVSHRLLREPPQRIGIPAIVLFELEVGIAKSSLPRKRIKQLRELTSLVSVFPFGTNEARASALIRARLEAEGTPIGPYDILIAGTALAHNATLVTHNTLEFSRIKDLAIEDWY
jgi:tRNA(fMet)-specific endonuclease VapC